MNKKILAIGLILYFALLLGTTPSALAVQVPAVVHTLVIVDIEAISFYSVYGFLTGGGIDVFAWANSIVEAGDDPFNTQFDIDFTVTNYYVGSSGVIGNWVGDLLAWARSIPKPTGVEAKFFLTGREIFPVGGAAQEDTIVLTAWDVFMYSMPILWQHEMSHIYRAWDHDPLDYSTVCVMNYNIQTTQWCSNHWNAVYWNRFHFGSSSRWGPSGSPIEIPIEEPTEENNKAN